MTQAKIHAVRPIKKHCSRCGRKIRVKVATNSWGRQITIYANHAIDCSRRGDWPDRYAP